MLLGCIADDFTGATDLADTLAAEGIAVVQTMGLPDADVLARAAAADAVVISLKSRSIPAADAVDQSLEALRLLQEAGCLRFFFKYCSTFDSTPAGNIGPVAEALAEALHARGVVFCPAFPETGRAVFQGHLFVGQKLLNESGMEHHPLNPMTDANLVRVLQAQCRVPVGLIPWATIRAGSGAVRTALDAATSPFLIADAIEDADLRTLGAALGEAQLVTGGSGLARGLPAAYRHLGLLQQGRASRTIDLPEGPAIVLAGSCSTATLGQVREAAEVLPTYRLTGDRLAAGPERAAAGALAFLEDLAGRPGLVVSSAGPEERRATAAALPGVDVSARIEATFAEIARGAYAAGVRRFVVAGGETSGSVVAALGVKALRIGPTLAAGVPLTASAAGPESALVLKSGNFGGPRFLLEALAAMGSLDA